jgi:predicted ATPase
VDAPSISPPHLSSSPSLRVPLFISSLAAAALVTFEYCNRIPYLRSRDGLRKLVLSFRATTYSSTCANGNAGVGKRGVVHLIADVVDIPEAGRHNTDHYQVDHQPGGHNSQTLCGGKKNNENKQLKKINDKVFFSFSIRANCCFNSCATLAYRIKT